MCGALSDKRTGLSFTTATGRRQHSHSRVRVLRDTWPYFTVSDSRFPQPGGPGPRIYIPQEQSGSILPPGTGFPFRWLLRCYSYIALGWTSRKHCFRQFLYCCVTCSLPQKRNYRPFPNNSRPFCLHYSGFSPHVTILTCLTRRRVHLHIPTSPRIS
jgi:hypothetical protein